MDVRHCDAEEESEREKERGIAIWRIISHLQAHAVKNQLNCKSNAIFTACHTGVVCSKLHVMIKENCYAI